MSVIEYIKEIVYCLVVFDYPYVFIIHDTYIISTTVEIIGWLIVK